MAYLRSSALGLDDKKSAQLINDFDYDPLAIKLLISYLERWHNNELSGLEHIPILHNDSEQKDQSLQRLIVAFEHKFKGCAELTLLYLLSLSTTPVPQARMEQVFQRNFIKRLLLRNDDYQKFLEPLSKLDSQGWDEAFDNLYSLNLLYSNDADGEQSLHIEQRICLHFRQNLKVQKYNVFNKAYEDMVLASGMSTAYGLPQTLTSVSASYAADAPPPKYGLPDKTSKHRLNASNGNKAIEIHGQLRALRYRLSVLKAQSRELNAMMLQSPALKKRRPNPDLYTQQNSRVA